MIKDLYNVLIMVDDLDAMVKFYKGTLKLPLERSGDRFALFTLSKTGRLYLQKEKADEGVQGKAGTKTSRVGFGLTVDDVDAVYKLLKGKLEFPRPPADADWGPRTVTCFDPEGNRIEFLQLKK